MTSGNSKAAESAKNFNLPLKIKCSGFSLLHQHTRMPSKHITLTSFDSINFNGSDTIFFLETNPKNIVMTGRKLCAFESAALANPQRKVVVLMNSRTFFISIPLQWLRNDTSKGISNTHNQYYHFRGFKKHPFREAEHG